MKDTVGTLEKRIEGRERCIDDFAIINQLIDSLMKPLYLFVTSSRFIELVEYRMRNRNRNEGKI